MESCKCRWLFRFGLLLLASGLGPFGYAQELDRTQVQGVSHDKLASILTDDDSQGLPHLVAVNSQGVQTQIDASNSDAADTSVDDGDTLGHAQIDLPIVEPSQRIPVGRALPISRVLNILRRNLLGQDETTITSGLLRDGNYLFIGGNDIKYETQLAGDVLIHNGLDRVTERAFDPTCDSMFLRLRSRMGTNDCFKRHWGFNTYATIQLYLRMLDDSSAPIRTPSFMPKWTIQWVGLRSLAQEEFAGTWASMWVISVVPLGHHSNGQDGCPLMGYDRNQEGDCAPGPTHSPGTVEINTRNGSFSARVLHRGGLHHKWIRLGASEDGYIPSIEREVAVGASVEYNHIAGEQSEVVGPLYGKLRWSASVSSAWRSRDASWASVEVGYRLQYRMGVDEPTIHLAEAVVFHRDVRPIGFYGRYYYGSDYLNIAFQQHVNRIEGGVTFDWQSFLRR